MQRHVDDGKQYIDVVNVGTKIVKALTGCAIIAGNPLGVCAANDVEHGRKWDGRHCIFAICGPTDIPVGGNGRVSIDFPLHAEVLKEAKRYRDSDVLLQPTENGFTDILHGDDVFEGLNHHRSVNLHYVLARGYEIGEPSIIDEWRSLNGDQQFFATDRIHWDSMSSGYGSAGLASVDDRVAVFTDDDSELRVVDVPDDYNGGFNSRKSQGQVAFSTPLVGTDGSIDTDYLRRRIVFLEFGTYEITMNLKFNPLMTGVYFVNDGVLTTGIFTDGIGGGGSWYAFGGVPRWVAGRSTYKLMVNRADKPGCITKSTDDEFEFRPSHWIESYSPGFGASEIRIKVWINRNYLFWYRITNWTGGDGEFYEYPPSLEGYAERLYVGEVVVDELTGEADWSEVTAALDALGIVYSFVDHNGQQVLTYYRQYDLPPFIIYPTVQGFYRVTERLFVEASASAPPKFEVIAKPESEFKFLLVVGKDGGKTPGIVKSVLELPLYYDRASHVDATGEYTFDYKGGQGVLNPSLVDSQPLLRSHSINGNISIRRLSADVIDLSDKHNASSSGGGTNDSGGGSGGGGTNPLPDIGGD